MDHPYQPLQSEATDRHQMKRARLQSVHSSDLWPASRLAEAIAQVAQHAKLIEQAPTTLPPLPNPHDDGSAASLGVWVEQWSEQIGIEAEAIHATYNDVGQLLQRAAPVILWLPANLHSASCPVGAEQSGGLVLLKGSKRYVAILLPDLSVRWVLREPLRQWLCQPLEERALPAIAPLLTRLAQPENERVQTERALLWQMIGKQPALEGWMLRLSPGAPLRKQLRSAEIQRLIGRLLLSYLAQLGLTALTWWMIGGSALSGQFTWGWVWAWALLLFTAIPLRLCSDNDQQKISLNLGLLLKQRLLYGILRLQPEQIRHQGAGQFFCQVMEADNIDNLALGGGLTAGLALLQVAMAAVLLKLASPLWLLPAALLAWLGLIGLLAWGYGRHHQAWSQVYRSMSSELVETMVGHRTRLAQALPNRWHGEEDIALAQYTRLAQPLDQLKSWLMGLSGRGWMVLALGGLVATLWSVPAGSVHLPVALAGILLALQALTSISNGMVSLIQATGVWQQVKPLFLAGVANVEEKATEHLLVQGNRRSSGNDRASNTSVANHPLLIGRQLEFRYREGGRLILRPSDLQIRQGERLLLEGASGSGKSTLAALLAGLRSPTAGLLLLHGYDRQTLGHHGWRRKVVLVPQFQENYLFTGSLAFNLLLGRQWPPTVADLQEAQQICQEVGLAELIARMPAGLQQMVGESGWRLSHGERSRLYLARALLQQGDLLILDESFAALDSENLEIALNCAIRRSSTLLVIAHP